VGRGTCWKKPTELRFNPLEKLPGTVGGLQLHPLIQTVDGNGWILFF
jgi:hypothetical protein